MSETTELIRDGFPFPPEEEIFEVSHGADYVALTFDVPPGTCMTVSGVPTRMGLCNSDLPFAPLQFEPPLSYELIDGGQTLRLYFPPASIAAKRRFFVKSYERAVRFPSGAFVEPSMYDLVEG